jgi:hypothetical protein
MTVQGSATDEVQRVVFIGAELTGKSTLCDHLARLYGTVAVPEIRRFLWAEKQSKLRPEDYVDIAEAPPGGDEQLPYARRFLLIDTNTLTTLLLGQEFGRVGDSLPDYRCNQVSMFAAFKNSAAMSCCGRPDGAALPAARCWGSRREPPSVRW